MLNLKVTNLIQNLGKYTLISLSNIGKLIFFASEFFYWIFRKPFFGNQLFKQIFEIGYLSLPVVGLTAIFSGMALVIQSYTGFARLGAEDAVATVVVLSVTRELGPVLAGLMVAGRVGASIAAEIGTMKVSEQIDTLQVIIQDNSVFEDQYQGYLLPF